MSTITLLVISMKPDTKILNVKIRRVFVHGAQLIDHQVVIL